MLYILIGEDDFSQTRELAEIKKGLGDQSLLEANTSLLDGQQLTVNQLRAVVETVPFLAEKRLVIIYGLLGRFEPSARPPRRKKATPPVEKEAEDKPFAECLSNIPEGTVLILIDGKIKNSNPLLKQLSAKAKLTAFPLLKNDGLRQWVKGRVAEQGATISPEAVDLLAKLVGGNLWVMSNEISKLALFASGRRIEVEDIKALVSSAQETNVFAMVDAILDFKVGAAEQLLEELLERGASPAYLLVMLARQARLVVQARELRRQRRSDVEIQDRLHLPSEFVLRKTLEQAQRYPLPRLREFYNKLLETDLAIKTGKYDGELALNLLIAELCRQFVDSR
jgi:DNA polymerase-3 subunit delta